MKQVIIRIQNEKGRTLEKYYYGSYNSYSYYAAQDVARELKKGLTAYIRIGNVACRFIDYEDCELDLRDYPKDFESIEDVIYDKVHDCTLEYYVKDYLPRY